ncbi:ArsR/SmtB family transcription factor [Nodosilinea nodulosa]|uniref:ArsR/SmtB family transcription factor n=1 Tax=Nodosilinea nodulosa TaxID=416001 RepID=UPI0002F5A028|nr:metalloregulator ArsR/SmtB family transcription factor [Nodosilinea nodulosa]
MDAMLSPAELEILAGRFKILAEPARLQILAALRHQEHNVQEICAHTGLHQGNASRHLRLMRDAGVVACRREGIWRYYRVIDTELLALCPHLHPSSHPFEEQRTP